MLILLITCNDLMTACLNHLSILSLCIFKSGPRNLFQRTTHEHNLAEVCNAFKLIHNLSFIMAKFKMVFEKTIILH